MPKVQIQSNPEPPIVIGSVDRDVEADVAMKDWKSPTRSPTESARTIKDTP